MFRNFFKIFCLFCFAMPQLYAEFSCCCVQPHQFYIGPEVYGVHRKREGGTSQHGPVGGVRAGYDFIKRYNIYAGATLLYAGGELSGKAGDDSKLKSHFRDFNVAGRIGYTLQQKAGWCLTLVPYTGYGYAEEINKFVKPSQIRAHFKIHYDYVPIGFLSEATLSPCWKVGINFEARYPIDIRNKVTGDRDSEEDIHMLVKNKMQYRLELPITYRYCCWEHISISLVPFYEFRHYGKQANYPFDFLETKLQLYGGIFKFYYSF